MNALTLYRLLLTVIFATFSFGALSDYSINLLCINRDRDERSPVICREGIFSQIALSAKKWAKLNPDAEVTFWYDSNLASAKAIEESKRRVEDNTLQNLKLRDIKAIAFVSNNPDAFSSYMPLYFRIDFLKLVILANEIINSNHTNAVFADAEVLQMDKEQLLNSDIVNKLRTQGLVANLKWGNGKNPAADPGENQFVQVLNSEAARSALKHTINVNLLRGITSLNLDEDKRENVLSRLFNSPFFSTVQARYLGGFAAKYRAKTIQINTRALGGEDKWVEYDEHLHGYLPFGNIAMPMAMVPVVLKGTEIVGPASEFVRYDGHALSESKSVLYKRTDVKVRPGKDHTDEVKPKPEGMVFEHHFWK